jgi:DNA-binding transcriptional LysR family regulator
MHIPWDDVAIFVAVAESGSTAKAARRLRTSQPTVSRRIAQLEERLGVMLFSRGVTGASLTSAGERFLVPAKRMAEWATELEQIAPDADFRPRGLVRITAPPGVAYDFVAPLAASLATELPDIRIEVQSRVDYLDLARREADLALRSRAPTQRDLVEVERLEFDNDAYATPGYLARLPKRPQLADVGFVAWAPPFEGLTPNRELALLVPGWRPAFASDDYLVQLRAAEAGVGAIFLGDVRHRFARPTELRRLGLDLGPHGRSSLHLVASRTALALPRVRAVADALARELRHAKVPARRTKRG